MDGILVTAASFELNTAIPFYFIISLTYERSIKYINKYVKHKYMNK